jgi:DNA uptake protein ComE-like DNA-binding protein
MKPPPTHHRAVALVLTVVLALGLTRWCNRGASSGRPAAPDLAPVAADGGARADAPAASRSTTTSTVAIDPNAAPAVELERLPGIGPALAGRIVAARAAGTVFHRADDLRRVRGIGPRTVERLAPYLRFDAGVPGPDAR